MLNPTVTRTASVLLSIPWDYAWLRDARIVGTRSDRCDTGTP
jgi:hypothetical protein